MSARPPPPSIHATSPHDSKTKMAEIQRLPSVPYPVQPPRFPHETHYARPQAPRSSAPDPFLPQNLHAHPQSLPPRSEPPPYLFPSSSSTQAPSYTQPAYSGPPPSIGQLMASPSQIHSPQKRDSPYYSHSRTGSAYSQHSPNPEMIPTSSRPSYHSVSHDEQRPGPQPPMPSPNLPYTRGPENLYRETGIAPRPNVGTSRQSLGIVPFEIQLSGSARRDQYEIHVRQQPLAARACGFGERDRRVIDPPPIVQLKFKDQPPSADMTELRYPFHVVHCTLWNESGERDETAIANQDRRTTRRLMGTLVSSPFVGMDENDQEGCFFCFPDLSCRTHGRYRLKFIFMRLEMNNAAPGGYTPFIQEVMSDVFTVFTAKDFPGMRASTPLTKVLKKQGCNISVKKGNDKTSHARDGDSDDDDVKDEQPAGNGEGAAAAAARTRKRRKS